MERRHDNGRNRVKKIEGIDDNRKKSLGIAYRSNSGIENAVITFNSKKEWEDAVKNIRKIIGKKMEKSAEAFLHGGAKQKGNKQIKKANRVLILILSIFAGYLGVDRFVIGDVGLGIFKLLTFGGFGIWWIIDVILIATKKIPNVE